MAAARLDAAEAVRLARVDEDFQSARWGTDPEVESQVARLRREVGAAQHFMELDDG